MGAMHPIDITAAVHKRGTNLAALARTNGLSSSALNYALKYPAKRAEAVLANFLGVAPRVLWPDRYDVQGNRLVTLGRPSGTRISAHRRARGQ